MEGLGVRLGLRHNSATNSVTLDKLLASFPSSIK